MNTAHTFLAPADHGDAPHEAPHRDRATDPAPFLDDDAQDDRRAAHGLLFSVALGGGLWLILLAAGWLILR